MAKHNRKNKVQLGKRGRSAFSSSLPQSRRINRTNSPLAIPIKLDDLKSEEALLAALTPEILNQTANLLGIRTAWLEGIDDDQPSRFTDYAETSIGH